MLWQPAATVKWTDAVPPAVVIGPGVTIPDDGQGGVQACLETVIVRGGAGASPFAQLAASCTLTTTLEAAPAENVPEKEKLLSLPKWPVPTWVKVVPLSYDAHTRTSAFVRDFVVASDPFQAVAVYDTLPPQSIVALISE
jgi:hypothetical protein